jgi:hypothetical protein
MWEEQNYCICISKRYEGAKPFCQLDVSSNGAKEISVTTHTITTLSEAILSISGIYTMSFGIRIDHNSKSHYGECCILLLVHWTSCCWTSLCWTSLCWTSLGWGLLSCLFLCLVSWYLSNTKIVTIYLNKAQGLPYLSSPLLSSPN